MSQESEIVNAEPHESQPITESAQVQEGDAELKIGKISRSVWPVLFAENRLSDSDIAFLISEDASSQFRTSHYQVIKETTGNAKDAFDANGNRRFYSNIILRYGDKQYLLTSQWREEGKLPLLAWFAEHGIGDARVIELCHSA